MAFDRKFLLATTMIAGFAVGAPSLAWAQDQAPAQQDAAQAEDADATEVEELVVTGSRIRTNEFTSTSPIQVLTTERAELKGVNDVAQVLQSSTLAAGSPQVNSMISSAFVTDGGPGAATVSLRGLGAQRTLVLVNGKRGGPAGTRGAVSSFDLNTLPQSSLQRVEILKDGASSIYGSDAVAGVVNLITKKNRDGGEVDAFYTAPFESGGEQMNFSGSYGKTLNRGFISGSFDYYKHNELKQGDREYTQCKAEYIFDPVTGKRADRIDPRTGKPACLDLLWGHVWTYSYNTGFANMAGRYQFDYDSNLGNYIPNIPPAFVGDYPGAPAGWFLVGQDAASTAVMNGNHPFDDAQTLIPEMERATAFIEGSFDLSDSVEAYGEVLLNRRKTATHGYRQFWNYIYTADYLESIAVAAGGAPGDFGVGGYSPAAGWTGPAILSPTAVTDHAGNSEQVDYYRAVGGFRGKFSGLGFLDGWDWDIYAQYSRSEGEYRNDVILDDALSTQDFMTDDQGFAPLGIGWTNNSLASRPGVSCVGLNTPISDRPCIDVNWLRPGFLRGDLTQAERDFLFGEDVGHTVYEQKYVEGYVSGDLFDLPAGTVGSSFGFHLREDSINDVPGEITRAGNAWGSSSAGITKGTDTTKEVFGELAIPVFKGLPLIESLNLQVSGRYTDVKTAGEASTYKVGLNWQITPEWRLRATRGTSFRAPGLFEYFLADETGFFSQRAVDPCIGWGNALAQGQISQRMADNCAADGVPANLASGGSSATVIRRGGQSNAANGLPALKPETSEATVIGLVWTPTFIDLNVAVDYFDILVKDEVASLGGAVLTACYNSEFFPTDPVCNMFTRNSTNHRIVDITAPFINISEQSNRGIDLTVQYDHELPWGDLRLDGQFTWQLEDTEALYANTRRDTNGDIGDPDFVGNLSAQFTRGDWTAFWGVDMIGKQANYENLGTDKATVSGQQIRFKAEAEFTTFHSVSVRKEFDTWTVLGGLANVFDELPPAVSTIGLGQYSTVGTSVLTSQYTEGYYGRRAFLRVSKKF